MDLTGTSDPQWYAAASEGLIMTELLLRKSTPLVLELLREVSPKYDDLFNSLFNAKPHIRASLCVRACTFFCDLYCWTHSPFNTKRIEKKLSDPKGGLDIIEEIDSVDLPNISGENSKIDAIKWAMLAWNSLDGAGFNIQVMTMTKRRLPQWINWLIVWGELELLEKGLFFLDKLLFCFKI